MEASRTPARDGTREAPALTDGRWIRPVRVRGERELAPLLGADVGELSAALLREARRRVSGLVSLERELEERIRDRWNSAEDEVRRRAAALDSELATARKRAEAELKDARARNEREGRAAGFRDGFARGREEGCRLGREEGRHDGLKEGRKEGKDSATQQVQQEMASAVAALSHAALALEERRGHLLTEAREGLFELALAIAARIVKREVREAGDVALRNVEKAIELIFRRGTLVIQVHPDDKAIIEKELEADPRWVEGLDAVDVRAAPDVERGGCRLVSGAGTVDMTIETQLERIEEALRNADPEPVRVVAIEAVAPSGAKGATAKSAPEARHVVDAGEAEEA